MIFNFSPDAAEHTFKQHVVHHTEITTRSARPCSCYYFLSAAHVYFFRQPAGVVVLVVYPSPGVGGLVPVMHGSAHLFDTGDASPPSSRLKTDEEQKQQHWRSWRWPSCAQSHGPNSSSLARKSGVKQEGCWLKMPFSKALDLQWLSTNCDWDCIIYCHSNS